VRAGLARGFTPLQPTLKRREKSIATIAEGKPEDDLLYTPLREPMVGVQPPDQEKLKSEAAKVIREIVQPAGSGASPKRTYLTSIAKIEELKWRLYQPQGVRVKLR
jgi:uncharacterized protein (DUF885 family)